MNPRFGDFGDRQQDVSPEAERLLKEEELEAIELNEHM
jgi:hypothetical protein